MVLQSSGSISLSQIRNEFGGPSSIGSISLSQYKSGGTYGTQIASNPNGIPSSNSNISFSKFYNSAKWTYENAPYNAVINAGPLDIASSSCVTACRGAYSFFRLTTSYTGPLVQIRRSTDNQIQDFYGDFTGSTLTLNNTSTTLTSWLNGATGFISIWYDQSGKGNHATQATTGSQPVLSSSAGNYLVDFQNTNNKFFNIPSGTVPVGTLNAPYTFIFRHGSINNTTNGGFIGSGTNSTSQANNLRCGTGDSKGYWNYWWFNDYGIGVPSDIVAGNTVAFTYNGSTRIGYINRNQYTGAASSGYTNAAGSQYIGKTIANEYLNGQLYYMYIFNIALTDKDRTIMDITPRSTITNQDINSKPIWSDPYQAYTVAPTNDATFYYIFQNTSGSDISGTIYSYQDDVSNLFLNGSTIANYTYTNTTRTVNTTFKVGQNLLRAYAYNGGSPGLFQLTFKDNSGNTIMYTDQNWKTDTTCLFDVYNWYTLMTKSNFAGTVYQQQGTDPWVQYQLGFGTGSTLNTMYSSNARTIVNYNSFRLYFEIYVTTGSAADGLFAFIGSTATNMSEGGGASSFSLVFQLYTGGGLSQGIYLRNGSGTIVAQYITSGFIASTWQGVYIDYKKGTTNTWKVNWNGVDIFTYSDSNNASFITNAGDYFGFGFRDGGIKGTAYVRRVLMYAK